MRRHSITRFIQHLSLTTPHPAVAATTSHQAAEELPACQVLRIRSFLPSPEVTEKRRSEFITENAALPPRAFRLGRKRPPTRLLLLSPPAYGILSLGTNVLIAGERMMLAQEPPPPEVAARKRTPSFIC